jgi:Raf kinase inhibitor-like YbhB/YbcL family protein
VRSRGAICALVIGAALAGCGGGETVEGPPPQAPEQVRVSSPGFAADGDIPTRFTCDGDDVSPPLEWSGVPEGTRELALLMEDPDAPSGTFVHWTLYAIPADSAALREGEVPAGAREGKNSFGDSGYGGPCPPEGDQPHQYTFIVYALRDPLDLEAGASPEDVRAAVADHASARGELSGRFGR